MDDTHWMKKKTYADNKHYDYVFNGDGTIARRTDGKRQETD